MGWEGRLRSRTSNTGLFTLSHLMPSRTLVEEKTLMMIINVMGKVIKTGGQLIVLARDLISWT